MPLIYSGATSTLLAALALCLTGCAGTPPASSQASAGQLRHCERQIGSTLCSTTDDDPGMASTNTPLDTLPGANLSQGARTGGTH